MDKSLIENIEKISFFNTKIEKIENFIDNKDYEKAYKAVAALIEMACIITLEKVFNERIEDSNIVNLSWIFNKHNEEEIKNILIDINGEYNFIKLNEVNEIDVLSLLGNLDDLVKIVLEKYNNIF